MSEMIEQTIFDRSIPEPNSGCWLWTGEINDRGYGKIYHQGKRLAAHRVSYGLFCGEIPDGLLIRHKCDNPSCVNPDHLEPGTDRDNVEDRERRGRGPRSSKTICLNGHPLIPENVYLAPNGCRNCKQCRAMRNREWRSKR